MGVLPGVRLWIIANQLIMTPYSVLPNEMTTDFNGRTMLSTTRMLFSGISTAVIPLGMAAFLNALGDKKSSSYTISMGFFIVLFAVFVFIAYKSTWELTPEEAGFYEAALEAEPLKPVFGWIFAELGPRKMFSLNFAGAIIGLLGLWSLWQTAAQNNTAVWNAMLYVVMVWWLIFRAMTWFIPWNVFPFILDVDMIMAGENRGGLYIGFQQFARRSPLACPPWLGAGTSVPTVSSKRRSRPAARRLTLSRRPRRSSSSSPASSTRSAGRRPPSDAVGLISD